MYDLSRFSLRDMIACGADLRRIGSDASSLEHAAQEVVSYLYRSLQAPDERQPSCALVRFFVTMPYGALEPELQEFARRVLQHGTPHPEMKCLTLLATVGVEPEWNSRRSSAGHQALPLESEASVERSPMISQLITQLGIPVGRLLARDAGLVLDADQHTFNVFHVPEAAGSPVIPAQQAFVLPYGVRSVLGFGGLLPSGDLFATILFSRRAIPRSTADLFRTLALNVKVAILPLASQKVFA